MNKPALPRALAIRALAVLALTLCASTQAQAVRKCRIDGHSVFQSAPCQSETRVVAAAAPPAAGEPPAAPKKRTLADVLRERDGADRARPAVREVQNDGASVLRSRMGAV